MAANYLTGLEAALSEEELMALGLAPSPRNFFAQQTSPSGMRQEPTELGVPRFPDFEPPPANSMRVESGPNAGKVVSLDFGGQQQPQAPKEKLGDPINLNGRMGRYSENGREVVFPDGSRRALDLESARAERMSWMDELSKQLGLKRGEAELAQTQEQIAASKEARAAAAATRNIREDPNSQAMLEKKFGKSEKGYQWDPSGRQVAMPGGTVDQGQTDAISAAGDTIRKIDDMIGARDEKGNLLPDAKPHPGFSDAVGAKGWGGLSMMLGFEPMAGSDAADFKARLDEVKGGAFLKAYESLKGGGAISEPEGKKATEAITRMSLAQSEAEYVKAAMEFRGIMQRGAENLRRMRGGQPASPTAPQGSQVFQSLPDPSAFTGKRMQGPDGIYKSDGRTWVKQ